jgi:hypothetical protein
MPRQNYDLPAWSDGAPPARNAANLAKPNLAIDNLDSRVGTVEDTALDETGADILYVREDEHDKALHDGLDIDSDTVDGEHASAFEHVSNKGAASGYAPLDSDSRVPTANLPASLAGGLSYEGLWDATSDSTGPLDAGYTAANGDYFKVSVTGTTSLGGITTWEVGDWAIYNGTSWDRIDQNETVSSVHGRTGAVSATSGDYNASQVTNTPSGNVSATNVQAAINELDTEKSGTGHTHDGLAPSGGSTSQVLKKVSATDYDYSWQNESGGSGGGIGSLTAGGTAVSPNSSGGTVNLAAGTNVSLTGDNSTDTVTINASVTTGAITGITAVDTIAALKAINTTNATNYPEGTTIMVRGYNASGDKAGIRHYRLFRSFTNSSTTAQNGTSGGTYVAPTTGTGMWRLEEAEWSSNTSTAIPRVLNIAWFGARGDNSTDDSSAIQSCFNQIPAASDFSGGRGTEVYVPNGSYRLVTGISTNATSFALIGQRVKAHNEGAGQRKGSTFVLASAGITAFTIQATANANVLVGPQFEYIHFYGNSGETGVRTTQALYFRGVNRVTLRSCTFTNVMRGCQWNSWQSSTTGHYGRSWADIPATQAQTLGTRILKKVSTTYYEMEVTSIVGGGYKGLKNQSSVEPTWTSTVGATYTDNQLVWTNVANRGTGGGADASWNHIENCEWTSVAEAIYIPFSGGITLIGNNCYNDDSSSINWCLDPIFIRIHGGTQHRIHDMKMDNKLYVTYGNPPTAGSPNNSVGIEYAGSGCIITGMLLEDMGLGIKLESNSGIGSGDDQMIIGNHFYGANWSNITGIEVGASCNNYNLVGNTYRGAGLNSSTRRIVDNSNNGLVADHDHGVRMFGKNGPGFTAGNGFPENNVSANRGTLYMKRDGTGASLYVKESGTGTTGWVAK